MNALALPAANEPVLSPRDLQSQIQSALPSFERARHTLAPLANYDSVDAVIADLKPSEPVFCITPSELRDAAASFKTFPGRALYAVKCNPHPFVVDTLFNAGITDFDVASLDEVRLIDGLFGKAAGQAAISPVISVATGEDPLCAFRQPPRIWFLTILSLAAYHACIYYATQNAPPAPAALLQGTTPLVIVLASALLPGERLRPWHVIGALLGFAGIVCLIGRGGETSITPGASFYLVLVGAAAALWGLYSVGTRLLPDVPSAALGPFYAGSGVVCLIAHFCLETWIMPSASEWIAICALGCLPMGLAIYCWDHGMKRGDIQALGAFSYTEPFIGALLVAIFTGATITWSLQLSGLLVVTGAIVASIGLWWSPKNESLVPRNVNITRGGVLLRELVDVQSADELEAINSRIIERLVEIGRDDAISRRYDDELHDLLHALRVTVEVLDALKHDAVAIDERLSA